MVKIPNDGPISAVILAPFEAFKIDSVMPPNLFLQWTMLGILGCHRTDSEEVGGQARQVPTCGDHDLLEHLPLQGPHPPVLVVRLW